MKFTPFSIKNQEFSRTVRGYDREEVRAYLENLSDEVERIQNENSDLKSQIENLQNQVGDFKRIEKNLQTTLISAQESSSESCRVGKKTNGASN
ncbi:MAG: DivIVA domain-containing protein [Melioribacteraceae bacterium]|nr:DivIVA domain-containing protein [Melioribacteraceae bacterium]